MHLKPFLPAAAACLLLAGCGSETPVGTWRAVDEPTASLVLTDAGDWTMRDGPLSIALRYDVESKRRSDDGTIYTVLLRDPSNPADDERVAATLTVKGDTLVVGDNPMYAGTFTR